MNRKEKKQNRINNRVDGMPVYSDKQPYLRPPRGDSWVTTSPSIRVGITGPSGISSRLGSPSSGVVSGGVSGVSGNTYAAGGGTVNLYILAAGGALVFDVAVTAYNWSEAPVNGNTWVAVGWDATSQCWWVLNADCTG